jgi:hypothetical protein
MEQLQAHAPDADAVLGRAYASARAAVEPDRFESMRRRVESLLAGSEPGPERGTVVDLTDQFVIYVPGVGAELRDAACGELGDDGLRTFVEALYVVDQTERLRYALDGLVPGATAAGPPAGTAGDLHEAVSDLHAAAVHLDALDPVTTELVRLRCARYHDCKT